MKIKINIIITLMASMLTTYARYLAVSAATCLEIHDPKHAGTFADTLEPSPDG